MKYLQPILILKTYLFNLGLIKDQNSGLIGDIKRLLAFKRFLRRHDFDFVIDNRTRVVFLKELIISKWLYDPRKTIYCVRSYYLVNYIIYYLSYYLTYFLAYLLTCLLVNVNGVKWLNSQAKQIPINKVKPKLLTAGVVLKDITPKVSADDSAERLMVWLMILVTP